MPAGRGQWIPARSVENVQLADGDNSLPDYADSAGAVIPSVNSDVNAIPTGKPRLAANADWILFCS